VIIVIIKLIKFHSVGCLAGVDHETGRGCLRLQIFSSKRNGPQV
jgi:hypothetical protein